VAVDVEPQVLIRNTTEITEFTGNVSLVSMCPTGISMCPDGFEFVEHLFLISVSSVPSVVHVAEDTIWNRESSAA
jgi:hypothetical protein